MLGSLRVEIRWKDVEGRCLWSAKGDRACVGDLRWDMGGDNCWGVMSNGWEGL